jgi:hypothetical protein
MRRVLLALAPSVLLVALVASACDDAATGKEGAPVGTVLGYPTPAEGRHVTVTVPDGRYDFTVGRPRHDLPVYDEQYDHAADGASLVAVSWELDTQGGPPAARTGAAVEPSFALVAGERRYSLDEAMLSRDVEGSLTDGPVELSGTAWVSVAGEPDDLAVSVDYDGLDQVVGLDGLDDRGVDSPASALYRPASWVVARGACAGPTLADGYRPHRVGQTLCRAGVVSTPYADGVGWVGSREQTWLVVDVRAYLGGIVEWRGPAGSATYDLGDATLTATYAGQPPAATPTDGAADDHQVWVFAANPYDLQPIEVTGTWPSTTLTGADAPGAPDDPTVTATWTVTPY